MHVQSYTKKQLTQLYGISSKTLSRYLNTGELYRMLRRHGYLKYQKRLQPLLIEIIFKQLGAP